MELSFRSKLLALVATATIALVAMVASSAVTAQRVEGHLEDIRRHYLPKVGLRPQLAAQFERIQRGFQDAVAASDSEKLNRTVELKKEFLRQLADASEAVDPAVGAQLERAVEDFHSKALAVSGRLIAHETGEGIVAQMAEMQALRSRAATLLDKATRFDESELSNAFAAAAEAQRAGSRLRVGLSLACVLGVLLLSLWISRDVLRGVADLTAGFRRFGEGDFGARIPVVRGDELGNVGRQANQMAQSLQRLESERSHVDWLKAVQSAISQQLRGELEPREVAERAASTLCRFLDCPVAAVYFADGEGIFRLLGGHALPATEGLSFRRGEGLVGQAALQTEIRIVTAPAEQLQIRSGFAQGSARAVALTPLLHNGEVRGVLELASLHPWPDRSTELLAAVRESIAIALDVARSRAEQRALLAETQRQTREVEAQRRALEEKNAALDDIRRRLEQQTEELTQASTYKSQFLANMSHELRTPLNAILGFTQLIHDEQAGPIMAEQRDFLGNVLTSSRHLLRLINDVLDLAKVESGKLDFRPELVELPAVIAEVTAILRTTAAEKGVRVEVAADPAIGQVTLDPARLKQVLYNYLSNALKFTPPRGVVTVRARPEGQQFFRLEVQDTGEGIQPQDLSRLFVEFQQLDAGAAKKHGGTGLGLALTKRIVEAQGGSVGVQSTPGVGSVFHAVLPRQAKGEARPAPVAVVQGAHENGPAILIVEDNADDQTRIVEALAEAGFAVETASTGAQALARIRERPFDAITLDLLLPDMSGVDLLGTIRAEGLCPDIPVVVLTVIAEQGAVAGFSVSDVLAKPVKAADLVDALRRAKVAPARRGPVLVVDDDAGSLKLMDATLKRCGYQTICSRDGEEALLAAAATPPSAVVLDLIMPRVDGFEFLDRFRKMEGSRRTPVIIWTVKDLSDRDRARLRETADAVVVRGSEGAATSLLRELNAFLPRRQVSS